MFKIPVASGLIAIAIKRAPWSPSLRFRRWAASHVMRNVTNLFEQYRECARHLRNTYFSTVESKDWDVIEDFDAVADVVFERLVLFRLEDVWSEQLCEARMREFLRLVPSSAHGVPVMISRERENKGYWDHPIEMLAPADAQIAFKDYFDWDQHALIDFRYYHGEILQSSKHPDIVGHELLIETQYADVFYIPERPLA
jgi:hypothetical protein